MSQPAITSPAPPRVRPAHGVPGEFHARCSLLRWVPEKKLTPTELREAKEAQLPRRYFELESGRRVPGQPRKGRWEIGYATCAGFETADPEAYLRHMSEEHSRPLSWVKGDSEVFSRSIRAGWRSPRLAAEGKPLAKEAAGQLHQCPSCELYAEVVTNADELWWTEHVRGCALAHRSEAS